MKKNVDNEKAIVARPLEVRLDEARGDQERMVKKFSKKIKKENHLEEWFERRYYKKPSVRRREKQRKAEHARRQEQKQEKK